MKIHVTVTVYGLGVLKFRALFCTMGNDACEIKGFIREIMGAKRDEIAVESEGQAFSDDKKYVFSLLWFMLKECC